MDFTTYLQNQREALCRFEQGKPLAERRLRNLRIATAILYCSAAPLFHLSLKHQLPWLLYCGFGLQALVFMIAFAIHKRYIEKDLTAPRQLPPLPTDIAERLTDTVQHGGCYYTLCRHHGEFDWLRLQIVGYLFVLHRNTGNIVLVFEHTDQSIDREPDESDAILKISMTNAEKAGYIRFEDSVFYTSSLDETTQRACKQIYSILSSLTPNEKLQSSPSPSATKKQTVAN